MIHFRSERPTEHFGKVVAVDGVTFPVEPLDRTRP
jgi:hypothetical protein